MVGTLASAFLISAGSVLVGQAAMRVCGATGWHPLAPAVGISLLILVAVPAIYVPGRAVTVAIVLALAIAGCALAAFRDRAFRPAVGDALAALPTAALTLVPFLAAGVVGTLGVSLQNDMSQHLAWAESYASERVMDVYGLDPGYPLGPHALAAAVARGLGIGVEDAFAGLMIAGPVLLAVTAAAVCRDRPWLVRVGVATLAGMPFLIASYYGQSSFKEILLALFVLALVATLLPGMRLAGRLRWVPVALVLGGVLSVYSSPGLAWPVVILGVWIGGLAVEHLRRGGTLRGLAPSLRAETKPTAIAAVVLAVVLVPQAERIWNFLTGAAVAADLGNLVGPISLWEAFGVWDNPDYRYPALDPILNGIGIAFVVALVLLGSAWWIRRGSWVLPAAAAASLVLWGIADQTQSAYNAAKALVIVSPLLIVLAARPLFEQPFEKVGRPGWWRLGAVVVVAVFVVQILGSSWDALRVSPVGPRDHMEELRTLRPAIDGGRTLFLGNDDFIRWELAGIPVDAPVMNSQRMDMRPEKAWSVGEPIDFDSLGSDVLNRYDWIVTPRDAAASEPPAELRLERETESYQLWRRTGTIDPRSILSEGAEAVARLECSDPARREILRHGGVAAIRGPVYRAAVPDLPPGGSFEVPLSLPAGTWELQLPYVSQYAIEVSAPGLETTLPGQLDRPGTRWPIGPIELQKAGTVTLQLEVDSAPLAPSSRRAYLGGAVLISAVGTERTVQLRRACGKLVDWYEPNG